MTSVISGTGLGLLNTSLSVLGGQQGAVGNASLGQSGSQVYVNGANGNLVIQRQDEILIGQGLDAGILRTYNSQGQIDGDNNDGWRIGVYKKLVLSGTVNTVGSSVTRTDGDGNTRIYSYDAASGNYLNKDGGGAYDTLRNTAGVWTHTDGNSRNTETYNSVGQLTQSQDADGNTISYTYNGSLITQIFDAASNQTTYLDYTGNNLNQIRTVSNGVTQTRTRYGYDTSNRLTSVTTDLSPADNSIADGKTFVTSYTYDGTSTRVTSIKENGQQVASFTYAADGKVASFADGEGRVTTLSYSEATLSTPITVNLNSAALTAPTPSWSAGGSLIESSTTATSASNAQTVFNSNGDGLAIWVENSNLYYGKYTKSSNSWSAPVALDGSLTGTPSVPHLSTSANGNALATWVQNNNVYARRFIGGVWDGATTIPLLENTTPTALTPVGAINDSGRAIVVFRQYTTSPTSGAINLAANIFNGTSWSTAATNIDDKGLANAKNVNGVPSVAIDGNGNASVSWLQAVGAETIDSVYVARYTAGTTNAWANPSSTTLESTTTAATGVQIAFAANGNGIATWVQGSGTSYTIYAKSYTANGTWSAATTLGTATAAVTLKLSVSANGNALTTWLTGGNIYARRNIGGAWQGTAAEAIETLTNTSYNPIGSINDAGQAVVAYVQTDSTINNLYARRYTSGAWGAATLVESSAVTITSTAAPSVAIDGLGNINAVYLQKNGTDTVDSVLFNRYNTDTTPYYTVKSTDTSWGVIAQTLYGNSGAGEALRISLNKGATPVVGEKLSGFASTLNYSTTTVTGGTATLTDVLLNKTELTFDTNKQLTQLKDDLGNTLKYSYNGNGDVASISDAKNNTTNYEYDSNGNRTLSRDAQGNTVTRTYGTNNELLTETAYLVADPDGAGTAQAGTPITTRYAYDSENHLRFTISSEGRVAEYRYNPAGKQIAAIQYVGSQYSLTGFTSTQTLTEAQLTTWVAGIDKTKTTRTDFAYDFRGNVQSSTTWASVNSAGDGVAGNESVTQYVYDQAGLLLKSIAPNITADANDYVTNYSYDGLGRLLTSSQWVSSTETRINLSQYDDLNRKVILTANNGLITTSSFDKSGLLLSQTQSYSSSQYGTTQYIYDSVGRLRQTQDPTGVKNHVLYDDANRKVADIDSDGSLTEYIYDANGQNTQVIRYATAVNVAQLTDAQGKPANIALAAIRPQTAALDQITRQVYDKSGRLVQVIDGAGFVTQSFYDGANRITDVIRYANAINLASLPANPAPSDVSLLITANSLDRQTRNFYSNDGQVLGSLDAEGYLSENKYDAGGRLVETIGYATATNVSLRSTGTLAQLIPATDPKDIHSYTLYNGKGQVNGSVDGEGYLTEIVYDLIGNASSSIRYATKVTYVTGASVASLRPLANAEDQASSNLYNGANQLIQSTTTDGTITQYSYNNVGQLISATSAVGSSETRSLTTRYDSQGRVINQLDGRGSALLTGNQTQAEIDAIWDQWGTKHTYDVAGRRTQTTDQYGNTSYFYYDSDNRLTISVNARGEVTQSVYNALNQQTETINYGTRIATTGLTGGLITTAITSLIVANTSLDSHTQYSYDKRGLLSTTTDALGYTTSQGYDAFGQAVSRTSQISATQNLIENLVYDKRGSLLKSVSDPTGINRITQAVYDAFGRITQSTDANGKIRSTQYDKRGRVILSTDALNVNRSTTYDAFDRVLTQSDGLGKLTSYSYNTQTRTVTVTTPEGVKLTTVKNRLGETVTVTDGRNNSTSYSYDKNGQLKTTVDAQGRATVTNSYDRAGRLLQSLDANGNLVGYTYDAVNRLLSRIVDPEGLNLVTSYQYDARGQATKVTDPNGVITQTQYDLKGQVTSVVVDPTTLENPSGLNLTTNYSYDRQGRTLTVTEGVGSAKPRTTQYSYDTLGRRTQEQVDPAGLNISTSYSYDKNDNVSTRTDANGKVTRYYYDAEDQLIYTLDPLNGLTKTDYDANGRVIASTQYATALVGLSAVPTLAEIQSKIVANSSSDQINKIVYDQDGRQIYSIDSQGGVSRSEYDLANNVPQVTRYANAIPAATAATATAIQAALVLDAAKDQVSRNVYDNLNRLIYNIDALGYVAENRYDANGNIVAQVQYAGTVNLTGQPTVAQVVAALPVSGNDRTTRNVYDTANRLVYRIDALGYVRQSEYDAAGRISRSTDYAQSVSLSGNPTQAQVVAALQAQIASTNNRSNSFDYDAAGRLIQSADAEGYAERYSYEALSNKTSFTNKTGSTWNYQYDAAGRLSSEFSPAVEITSVQDVGGNFVANTTQANIETRIAYDAAGNVTSRTEAYGRPEARTTRYEYDALNRQVKTIFPQVAVYDAAADNLSNGVIGVQSSNVSNTAWIRSGNTLVQAGGTSLLVDIYQDLTPTSVTATVYRSDNSLVGVINTDVNGATNWTGQVNLSVSDLPPGSYRTDVVITGNGWTRSGSYNIVVGTLYGQVARTETSQSLYSQVTYDALGNAVVNRDVLGNYSYKVYDKLGRVQYEIDPERYLTEHRYDNFSNQLSLVRYATALSFAGHSNAAQAFSASEIVSILNAQTVAQHAGDRILSNQYDKLGRLTQVTEPAVYTYDPDAPVGQQYFTAGKTTQNSYNTFGQLISQSIIKNPLANTRATTTYYYDNNGNRTAEIDALGYLTKRSFDGEGNLLSQVEYAKALTAGSWSTSSYAAPVTTTAQNSPNSAIGYDRELRYSYDRKNQKISETRVNAEYSKLTGDLGIATQYGDLTSGYGYDGVGNLTRSTDVTGVSSYTYYDALGRVVATADPSRVSDTTGGTVTFGTVNVGNHYLNITPNSATAVTPAPVGGEYGYGSEYGYSSYWEGSNSVSLSWDNLQAYGDGGVTVIVDYNYSDLNNTVVGSGQQTRNYSSQEGLAGATLTWDPNQYGGLASINRVRVYKKIDGQDVLIHDRAASGGNNRLSFRKPADGSVATLRISVAGANSYSNVALQSDGNLYAVDLTNYTTDRYDYEISYTRPGESAAYAKGTGTVNVIGASSVGSRNVVATVDESSTARLILSGNLSGVTGLNILNVGTRAVSGSVVDLSGLARGTYQYTVIGNASVGGSFELKQSTVAGAPAVQEIGSSATTRLLNIYNIPADAVSVNLEYRRLGDTGPYLSKTLGKGANGWQDAYDDIANGRYEYKINTVRTGSVTTTYTGNFEVKRGDYLPQSVITGSAGQTLIPLTLRRLDAYGNVVQTQSYAKGAVSANSNNYTLAGVDAANDRSEYNFFDAHSHLIRSVDANGASVYSAYDAAGRVAKTWQSVSGPYNYVQNKVDLYAYDKLGQQIGTTQSIDLSDRYGEASVAQTSRVSLVQTFLNSGIAASAHQELIPSGYDESGNPIYGGESGYSYVWVPNNSVNLSWNTQAALGGGDVQVILDYNRSIGGVGQQTQTFSAAASATGVTLNWDDLDPNVSGVSNINRVRVYKRDNAGAYVLIHDRASNGAYGGELNWTVPSQAGTQSVFQYRLNGSTTWFDGTAAAFGAIRRVDLSVFAAGTYQFQVLNTVNGVTTTAASGTFVANGSTSSISNALADTPNPAASLANWNQVQARYNAFGEVTAKGNNGGYQEYSDYDNAGRVWRSNAQGGVNRVYLYDTQGQATAEISSQQLDLRAANYTQPQDIAALTSNVVRNTTKYDLLERAVSQTRASYTVQEAGLAAIGAAFSLNQASLSSNITASAHQELIPSGYDESGNPIYGGESGYSYTWNPTNSVAVNWNSTAGWGDGDIVVTLTYSHSGGGSSQISQTFSSAAAISGATVTWDDPSYGVTAVTRTQVWKKDRTGQLVLLHDRNANGAYGNQIIGASAPVDTQVTVRYKVFGTGTYTNGVAGNLGGVTFWNLADLAANNYDYEVLYTRVGDTQPYSTSSGTFSINGASGSITNSTAIGATVNLNVASVSSGITASAYLQTSSYTAYYPPTYHVEYVQDPPIGYDESGTPIWGGGREYGYDYTPTYTAVTVQDPLVPYTVYTSTWIPTNSVAVSWNSTAGWGNGDVVVTLTYNKTDGSSAQISQTYSSAAAVSGATVTWSDPSYGISAVTRTQVWKKDSSGQLVLLHDRSSNGAYGNQVTIAAAPQDTRVTIRYKLLASSTYSDGSVANLGGVTFWNLNGIAANTYDYEVLYTRIGETQAYAQATGTLTVNGASGSIANNTAVTNTSQPITPLINQTIDRWGNVIAVNDPRSTAWVTTSRYNYVNQAIASIQPQVANVGVDGLTTQITPTVYNYYDALGRQIGARDANGNLNTQHYDAAGQVVKEVRADSGTVKNAYDIFGNKIQQVDANNKTTTYTYDKKGQSLEERHPIGTDRYVYNELGNRISVTNANNETTRYWYNVQGQVTRVQLPLGQLTGITYDTQGRKIREINGNGDITTNSYDYFGKLLSHTDLGGASYSYSYNFLNQLLTQTNSRGQNQSFQYYENSSLKQINDNALNAQTYYAYDAAGNRTREKYTQAGVVYQDSRLSYDALGRLSQVGDIRYSQQYSYDANGNRRRVLSTYYDINTTLKTIDNWYTYDNVNRILISQGTLVNGSIQINSSQGVQLAYDGNGNRRTATQYLSGALVTETYNYDDNNRLTTTNRAGVTTSSRAYDSVGRVKEQLTFSSPGVVSERRVTTYDANSRVTNVDVFNGSGTKTQAVNYTAYDNAGNVLNYNVQVLSGTQYTNYYAYSYNKYESYKESVVAGSSSYFQPGNTTSTYDVNGNLTRVVDQFNANKTRTFINNALGQVLQKTENGQVQNYFYANGNAVGSSGALSAADFDYNYTPVSDQYPSTTPGAYVVSAGDTLQSIALAVYGDAKLWYLIADANGIKSDTELRNRVGLNLTIPNKVTNLHNDYKTFKPYAPGEIIGDTTPTLLDPPPPPAPKKGGCGGIGAIIVVIVAIVVTIFTAGAALAAIAPAGAVFAGTTTAIAGASTFSVGLAALSGGIAAGTAVGAASALAVGFATVAAAAIGGAVGSIVSQGVGIAIGVQDKFSFGQVALGALGAGLTAGLGVAGVGSSLPKVAGAALRAGISSVATQGASVALGLQDKFNWRGVAASAVAAGVGAGLPGGGEFAGNLARRLVTGSVYQLIANKGKIDFTKVATDAFGNALGDEIVAQIRLSNIPDHITKDVYALRGYKEAIRNGETDAGALLNAHRGVAESLRYERFLKNRLGAETARGPDGTLLFASFDRAKGDFAFIDIDNNYVKPETYGAEVVQGKSYLDENGKDVYSYADSNGNYNIPENAKIQDFKELRYEGKFLGRDFGPDRKVLDEINRLGVTAGDPAEALRTQYAVDRLRHPELAGKYIDPNTGQVNPLLLDKFLDAARERGLIGLVSSNGLGNFYQQARNNIRILAEGIDVLAVNVYNPTIDGGFARDTVADAIPANLFGQIQTAQVAIGVTIKEILNYNRGFEEIKGYVPQTYVVLHSQGTIDGNLAINRLNEENQGDLVVYNVGTASYHLPKNVALFTNITDRNDIVTNATGGRNISNSEYALARRETYKTVETDITNLLGREEAEFNHSFHLYAQTPEFQAAFGFKPRAVPIGFDKPFSY